MFETLNEYIERMMQLTDSELEEFSTTKKELEYKIQKYRDVESLMFFDEIEIVYFMRNMSIYDRSQLRKLIRRCFYIEQSRLLFSEKVSFKEMKRHLGESNEK